MIKNLQAQNSDIRPPMYKNPFSLKLEIGSFFVEIIKLNQNSSCFVIELIHTDSVMCANCKEL